MRQINAEKRKAMISESGMISHNPTELAHNAGFHGPNAVNMLSNWLRLHNCFIEVGYYRLREGRGRNSINHA
jgi:hypothetical protein